MKFERGQVLLIDLGVGLGSEQSNIRPCVVVSNSANNTYSEILSVIPMTTKEDTLDFHLRVLPSSLNNLSHISYCLPEQIRCISIQRVIDILGCLTYLQIRRLEDNIRFQLDL